MRRFITLIMLTVAVCVSAQKVKYKGSSTAGCNVAFTVEKQDGKYYLYAEIKSQKQRFAKNVTLKMKNFRNEVITLNGEMLTSDSETSGVIISYLVIPYTTYSSTAVFLVRPDQFAAMSSGIQKIQMNTVPEIHERRFLKDKIGKKLYRLYEIAYSKSSEF